MNFRKVFIFFVFFCFIVNPVVSFADDFLEESVEVSFENNAHSTEAPVINARHAVVLDRASKTILYGKGENEKCKMASTTKIITAIVVLENTSDLNSIVTVSKKASGTGGSRLGLAYNNEVTVNDLLYGLLMVSGNDAAVALAEFVGGSVENFAEMMNQKANSLGLVSSHFVTPHGLDQDEHYTTAFELAKIADYALNNKTFSKIVYTKNYIVSISGKPKNLNNTNELLGYLDGVYGVKTGFTNGANRCLVSSCKRGNLDIVCVVLGCDTKKDRTLDSIKLINYIFDNFSIVNVKDILNANFDEWSSHYSNSIFVEKGVSTNVDFCLDDTNFLYEKVAIKNDVLDDIYTPISISNFYEAPLNAGDIVGSMDFFVGDMKYFSVNILNKNLLSRKNVLDYWKFFLENYFAFWH